MQRDIHDLSAFIECVCERREQHLNSPSIPCEHRISNDCIRHLLRCCFFSSMLTDESRPVRVALHHLESGLDLGTIVRFSTPVVVESPSTIAKLAAIVYEDCDLFFQQDNDNAAITHIGLADYRSKRDAQPRTIRRSTRIVVKGPGQLEYYEEPAEISIAYSRGDIITLRAFRESQEVGRWLHDIAKRRADDTSVETPMGLVVRHLFPMLELFVRTIIFNHHGGTILFIPSAAESAINLVRPVCSIDLLAMCVLRAYNECDDLERASGCTVSDDDSKLEMVTNTQMLGSIASLANADGAVVLSRDLVLRGFGGIIAADSAIPQKPIRTPNGQFDAQEVLKHRGTRHKSAYSLCNQVPDTVAFVVSQDGDFRLFVGTEDAVLFYDGLTV